MNTLGVSVFGYPKGYFMSFKEKFNPAVTKHLLVLLAGFMWICTGMMLISFAATWLVAFGKKTAFVYASMGLILSLFIHHFGFLRIVDKNLGRLSAMEGKKCVFAFISWKSYIIVAIMIIMGITLRHSAIPKQYLSVLYLGIGTALFLSSIRYFRNAF